MRFIIRADAGPSIGGGHVMRSLALAQELKRQSHSVIFVMRECFAQIEARIAQEEISIIKIDCLDNQDDARQTTKVIKDKNIDWIVLDGYKFTNDYQTIIRSSGVKILSIDDIAETKFVANIIVNQNPWCSSGNYDAIGAKLLLGTNYTLLREEFLVLEPKQVIPEKIEQVLINTGAGMVSASILLKILGAIEKAIPHQIAVNVLVGMNKIETQKLQKAQTNSTHNISFITPKEFSPQILRANDLAISAAGSTTWELAYFGLPIMSFVIADNQAPVASSLEQAMACLNLGWLEKISEADLLAKIKDINSYDLRKKLAKKAKELVDGRGKKRIVEEIINHG